MKKFHWMTVVLVSALAAVPALSGCSIETSEDEAKTGSVSMALSSVTNGTEYRLSNAVFQIDGLVSTSLQSSDMVGETVLSAVLPVGGYTSSLASGWVLQRNDGGTFVNVQATLVSQNPVAFQVNEGSSTSLVYQFDTDGTIISIGSGSLDISIAVNETGTPAACTPFGAGCAASEWCVPGALFGAPDQCVQTGPLQPGDACDGTVGCGMNQLCGDIGLGNQCLELCSGSTFGQPCPGGGGVCTDFGDPTVGLCQ
ncbi:MAG TPA: hypothetical protein VM686_05305 [Polyangiaceae bacterium]|nr:hypothetical protein [Polyangiaceae bacterium]